MTKHHTQNYYDDFSNWYENERHHGYHAMLDDLELSILSPLAVGREVLEVGCGTGLIMKGLQGKASKLVGLDLSAGMLEKARERGFEVVQGNATELPFDDGSFDLVYSYKVLAHVPQIETALKEMSRVLRPGGYAVAEFYNKHSIRNAAKIVGGPKKISADRTEAEVFTRWDTAETVKGYLPSDLVLDGWRGVRVFTPAASVFKLPMVGTVLPRFERLAMNSPLARFGGFLVAVCRKI